MKYRSIVSKNILFLLDEINENILLREIMF